MSEYQYYEFQALDRRLDEEEMAYIHTLSSRVQLTPTQAVFVYNFGDFRANPEAVLDRCFDAMLYTANWGSKRLMFRFPKSSIDTAAIKIYCTTDAVSLTETKNHLILDFDYGENEPGDYDDEIDSNLSGIVGVRDEILRGDFRALYLSWLKGIQIELEYEPDKDDEDDREPPVPANLKKLSPALQNFADFLEIDQDLIAVAAQTSPTGFASAEPLERWLRALADDEKVEFLLRVANGEPNVGLLLIRRLRELFDTKPRSMAEISAENRRTVGALLGAVQGERDRRAAKLKQEAERKQAQRMAALAPQESATWEKVWGLIAQKQVKAYDEAVIHLKNLRELAEYHKRGAEFEAKLRDVQQKYPTLTGLHSRLRQARLIK
ncbi:MAG: hypothetical protein ACYDBJ_15225 [Aggregatilineales bacterium]